jgi:hypothetical protein
MGVVTSFCVAPQRARRLVRGIPTHLEQIHLPRPRRGQATTSEEVEP